MVFIGHSFQTRVLENDEAAIPQIAMRDSRYLNENLYFTLQIVKVSEPQSTEISEFNVVRPPLLSILAR